VFVFFMQYLSEKLIGTTLIISIWMQTNIPR